MHPPDLPDDAQSGAVIPAHADHHARAANIRGAVLMIVSTLTFVANDTVMKFVVQELPLYESMALRGAFVLPLLVAYALYSGALSLRIPRHDRGTLALRTVADVVSSVLYLLALQQMPLANLSAIIQSLPLLVTLAAAVFFGERLGPWRIGAILVGFVGVLIILRPGTAAFDVWSALAVAAVLLIALRDMVTRRFDAAVSSTTISIYAAGSVMLFALAMAPTEDWRLPTVAETGLLMLSAALITVGYMTAIATMRVGEISFVAPFRYSSLIWAVMFGLLVFGEWPDLWTQIGSALIVAAGLLTIWREGPLRPRTVKTPPVR